MLFKSLKVTTDFKLEIKQYLLRYKTQLTKCKKNELEEVLDV